MHLVMLSMKKHFW